MKESKDFLEKEGMHAGAQPDKFSFAKMLRKAETSQEKKLWKFLCTKPMGFKFRRQHPFSEYILDFYCHRAKLVIELDGHQHKTNLEYDHDRTKVIESYGLRLLRFENLEVDDNFEKVIGRLIESLRDFG